MENSEKKLTGYSRIDKPWMKYYDGKNIFVDKPNTNITDYLKKHYIEDGFKDVILKEYLNDKLERISNSYL